ncbi:MAG: terminase gpA endonuclease subunit [Candidatus Helarchaeota archaeon]
MSLLKNKILKVIKEFKYSNLDNIKNIKISKKELKALKIPKRFSTVDLAEKIRIPLKSNAFPKINLKMTPYLIDPIKLIADPNIEWLFMIAPTQSGKTVLLQIVVADCIAQNPGTLLYIYPDENNGKIALQEKVIAMIRETSFLMEHTVPPLKVNLSTKKILLDNMTIYPGWSGSLGTLSSKAAKIIILDEIRLMKKTIGKESNAIQLADDRLTTFKDTGNAQAYGVSTPAVKGDLLYNQMLVKGTIVLYWHIKCPYCEKYFIPLFFNMLKDSPDGEAIFKCPICKEKIKDDKYKIELNKNGAYGLKGKHGHFGKKVIPNVKELTRGFSRIVFRFSSMSSPFRSFQTILNKYYQTKDNIDDYKNFWQCWLAEFWEDDISQSSEISLRERINHSMKKGKVPTGTKFLTGGVDVGDAGFYVTIWAWGTSFKHLVDSYFINCHKDSTDYKHTKKILKLKLVNKKWDNWKLACWAIDIADGDRSVELRNALDEFENCYKIIGATDKQVVNVIYKSKLDYYSIKRAPYLEQTDTMCKDESVTIYDSPEQTFFTQFVNTRKIKLEHPKTGELIITWKKCGQDDYRAATTYAWECLDILFNNSDLTLRDLLDDEKFEYNPVIQQTKNFLLEEEEDNEKNFGYDELDIDNDWFKDVI